MKNTVIKLNGTLFFCRYCWYDGCYMIKADLAIENLSWTVAPTKFWVYFSLEAGIELRINYYQEQVAEARATLRNDF